jgi:hypothetical protein
MNSNLLQNNLNQTGQDWPAIDRWLMGEAWTGARLETHLVELCDKIGPRWSSSQAEWQTIAYIRAQMEQAGLAKVGLEEFQLDTWAYDKAEARIVEEDRPITILPFNRCPPVSLQAPIVDVGFGTPREIETTRDNLPRAIAMMALVFEPFTTPVHLGRRLRLLAEAGAGAAIVVDRKEGGRVEYHTATDWRESGLDEHPLPTVAVSREGGALLRRLASAGKTLRLEVDSRFYQAPTANVSAELTGARWPEEHLLLGGHHDTVYGSPGGNDNASSVITLLETARVLARLQAETGQAPGRSIRFVTFSAEEQKPQGSSAYVARHYGPEPPPRLAINLDELSTGHMKGLVLAFPHLRNLVQNQLDTMNDGLKCHVMSQLDCNSDHYPFLLAGLDAAHLWRWRFYGRHADADFHHEPGDTADKVNLRELKEYIGQLARILLRLSHVPPEAWPQNPQTPAQVQTRIERERAEVIRVF